MKALVLAGTLPQIELIKNLQARGYYVILADNSKTPLGKKYADKYYPESTLDIEAIKNIAVKEKVDLIFTVCTDQALNTVTKVSEELGLPCYIDAQTGLNVTNKKYMKTVFTDNGIPTAKHIILDSGNYDIPKNFSYPLIVKPVDCNSSKGVAKVNNTEELESALNAAFEFSRTDNAVVEEYIEGKELSADFYIHDGEPVFLCLSQSDKIKDDGKFVIFRSVVPAGVEDTVFKKVCDAAKKIAKAFNLKNCPMLIQMLYKDGEIYVIEFSARTGGCLKFKLINNFSGVDIIDLAVNATLKKSEMPKPVYNNKYIINEFIYTCGGVYDKLSGFEELKADGTIDSYYAFKAEGTEFGGVSSSGDRAAGYTIIADSYEELNQKYLKATANVKVLDKNGNDIARHDLSYPVDYRQLPTVDFKSL